MSSRFRVREAGRRSAYAALAFACATSSAAAAPASALTAIVVRAPASDLRLEVATTPEQQERGLMYRTSLLPHTGMIFVFSSDGPVAFWMKNTLVPLDMIFVAAGGRVRGVDRNVKPAPATTPDDRIPRENGAAKYVIEIPAGEAARDGIAPGVVLVIPKI